MENMFIIDAHQDIAYNALEWGRDPRSSVAETREREAREHPDYCNEDAQGGICMLGLPELRRAGFLLIFGTIFAFPLVEGGKPIHPRYRLTQVYRTPAEAERVAREQVAFYDRLAQEAGLVQVRTRADLARLLAAWSLGSAAGGERPLGVVLLMEGADPIQRPADLEEWVTLGLRVVGLAWAHGSRYCGGNGRAGPLTPAGRELLREMQRLGLILDTSHMADESFWQALAHFEGPVIASHSNCRALVDRPRHLSDEMICAIAERGGVIGVVPVNAFLDARWSRQQRFPVPLSRLVEHIDHICQLTGSAAHVGIGSDVDGGFGRDETPAELDTVADFPRLAEALATAGYSQEHILQIMGGNWVRLLERTLPPASDLQQGSAQ